MKAEGEMPAKRRSPIAPFESVILFLVVGTLALMLFPVLAAAVSWAADAEGASAAAGSVFRGY